jgi:hypothetical protein
MDARMYDLMKKLYEQEFSKSITEEMDLNDLIIDRKIAWPHIKEDYEEFKNKEEILHENFPSINLFCDCPFNYDENGLDEIKQIHLDFHKFWKNNSSEIFWLAATLGLNDSEIIEFGDLYYQIEQ